MGLDLIPTPLHAKYQLAEYDHACAILARDFPTEFQDILDCLGGFVLKKTAILTPGGGRSPIPIAIDGFLHLRGWREKKFDIEITVDGEVIPIPTHKIDNFKNRVGLEVEWNNKTEFYDRDLNNFRPVSRFTKILNQRCPMSEHRSEVWFLNEYTCCHCGNAWKDEYDACPDDDCPRCGARHISPHTSTATRPTDSYTEPIIVQEKGDGDEGRMVSPLRGQVR